MRNKTFILCSINYISQASRIVSLVHGPNFEGHVVAAAGQELALGIPLDCVHLVCMALDIKGIKIKMITTKIYKYYEADRKLI